MAVCTNKQERLAIDLLKKLNMYEYFEYTAGSDTFKYNKPDPRHLTNVVEIVGGSLNKTIMIGDSEVDAMSAENAKLPFVLVENGYTEKTTNEKFLNYRTVATVVTRATTTIPPTPSLYATAGTPAVGATATPAVQTAQVDAPQCGTPAGQCCVWAAS